MTCRCLCIGGCARPTSVQVRDARFVLPVTSWLLEIRYVSSIVPVFWQRTSYVNCSASSRIDQAPMRILTRHPTSEPCTPIDPSAVLHKTCERQASSLPVDKKMFHRRLFCTPVSTCEFCNESTLMRTQTPNVSTTPPLKPMKPESTHPKEAETWAGKQSPSTNICVYDCIIRPSSLIDFCHILVTSDLRKHGSIYPSQISSHLLDTCPYIRPY